MYLTRMELNTKNMDTIRLLGSQEKIHGLVESGFLGERKRNLWRLEYLGDRLYLLILSPDRPDLSIGVRTTAIETNEHLQSIVLLHIPDFGITNKLFNKNLLIEFI